MGGRTIIAKGFTAAALALAAMPAAAQFSDSYNFLQAVRERDGQKATDLVRKPGTPIDTRDNNTGETPLMIVTKGRDLTWMNFMLGNGAKTEIKDRQGNTALIAAAQIGFTEGVQLLLRTGASVDAVNNAGETGLILATQHRDVATVRALLAARANPKLADRVAGKSALDYATEDARAGQILRLLQETKPAAPVAGPKRPGS